MTKKKTTNESQKSTVNEKQDFQLNEKQAAQFTHNMREAIENASFSRNELLKQLIDGNKRSINDSCQYPETCDITTHKYREMYNRDGLGNRVVNLEPDESWVVNPSLVENEDNKINTEFEIAFDELGKQLDTENWYKSSTDNFVWEYLHRADRLSGIGQFGVILLGINDGKELSEPVEPSDTNELTYVRTFDESQVTVSASESTVSDPRYSQPLKYEVVFETPFGNNGANQQSLSSKTVHHTRIVHLADNILTSELYGAPRMLVVYNNLLNIRKLLGGSAEMYWRGAFPGYSAETHPSLGGDVEMDIKSMQDDMEAWVQGLQRFMTTSGMTIKSLAPQVVDPSPQIERQLDLICIAKRVPKRILVGSERGELASSQDTIHWNNRVMFRQNKYLTPRVIAKFVNTLISLKILPTPTSYDIVWPNLNTLDETTLAEIALKRTQALGMYVQSGAQTLITPTDFITRFLGLSVEEAKAMIDSSIDELMEESNDDEGDSTPFQ